MIGGGTAPATDPRWRLISRAAAVQRGAETLREGGDRMHKLQNKPSIAKQEQAMKTGCLIFLFCAVTLTLVAQERPSVLNLGGFAGYGINTHMSDFRALPGIPCCSPGFDGGTGGGLNAGVLAGYRVSASSSVQVRLGYEGLHGVLLREEVIGNTPVRSTEAPFDTTAVAILTQHSIDATLHALFLEPTFVWSPLRRLGLHAGVSGAWLLTSEFYQKEELQSPSTVVFTGSESRIRNEASGDIPGASALLLHAVAGVSYDFPVSAHAVLAPEVRFRMPLNSIAGVDWRVGNIAFGVAFRIDIAEPEQVRIERDTVYRRDTVQQVVAGIGTGRIEVVATEDSTTEVRTGAAIVQTTVRSERYRRVIPAETPTVQLEISGVNTEGERTDVPVIIIEEVQAQESFPLMPYVFFPRNASTLEEAWQHRVEQAAQFDTTALQFSALAVYDNMLNILGERMRRFPESTIVITGCRNDDEDEPGLSQRRAQAIQNYLTTTWAVEPERITLQARGLPDIPSNTTTDDGRGENRRAEISTGDPRLFAPVVLRTVERVVTPPALECVPDVATSDPATWRLALKSVGGGKEDILLDTTATGIPSAIHLQPDGTILAGDTALVGELTATDSRGGRATAERRVPLRQITIASRRGDSEIEVDRFALVLFNYNSTGIDAAGERILEQVKSRVRPQSRVRIIGYTDRMGESDYNKKLAERRCREVHRLLGLADAGIEAVGSDRVLFDNDLPHGRMYSRTVHIIIETPVEKSGRP